MSRPEVDATSTVVEGHFSGSPDVIVPGVIEVIDIGTEPGLDIVKYTSPPVTPGVTSAEPVTGIVDAFGVVERVPGPDPSRSPTTLRSPASSPTARRRRLRDQPRLLPHSEGCRQMQPIPGVVSRGGASA